MVLALAGVALGATGLVIGLRPRPAPTHLTFEDAENRVYLGPDGLFMRSKDDQRRLSLKLGNKTVDSASLDMVAGGEATALRLAVTAMTGPDGKTVPHYALLSLGHSLGESQVTLSTGHARDGAYLEMELEPEGQEAHDRIRFGQGAKGPSLRTELAGVTREAALSFVDVPKAPPAAAQP